MKDIIFDIETDGLLEDCTQVYCIVLLDLETGKLYSFSGEETVDGLFFLKNSERIIGHNIISFDLPVLEKIYKWKPPSNIDIVDTLVMSKLIYPDSGSNTCCQGLVEFGFLN